MTAIDRKQAMDVLKAFGKAFNKGDADGILAQVTDDFEWRMHEGPEAPEGAVIKGLEATRKALAERAEAIETMKFSEADTKAILHEHMLLSLIGASKDPVAR